VHISAVKAFNARLRAGGITSVQFPEHPVPEWLPKVDGREIFHEYYLAVEGSDVRGGYVLKQQPFYVGGQIMPLCEYRLPLSEGQVDNQFASVGVQLYLDATRKQSRLYTVGIGGFHEPAAQMLARAGWSLWPVPFFFRVLKPFAFLRNMTYLRSSTMRKLVLDAMAYSGLGWLAVHGYQAVKARAKAAPHAGEVKAVDAFGSWADDVWQAAHPNYKLIAQRDQVILNLLYPASDPRWIRLQVTSGGQVVGWAAVLNIPMDEHAFFGNMRVGSIIDCLAVPGHEGTVARLALDHLQRAGADIVVTNLVHRDWQQALRSAGFLEGPSNFIFAASKPLVALLQPLEDNKLLIHMTRGDGGGPTNLLENRDKLVAAKIAASLA